MKVALASPSLLNSPQYPFIIVFLAEAMGLLQDVSICPTGLCKFDRTTFHSEKP